MSAVAVARVEIPGGADWVWSVVWGETPFTYKTIAAVTLGWPTTLTVNSHGIPTGVSVAAWIKSAVGPKINVADGADPHIVKRVDANTLEVIDLNTLRQTAYTANSGVIRFAAPKDLTGWTAKCDFKRDVSSTALVEASTATEITLGSDGTIAFALSATQTRALLDGGTDNTTGIAQLELTDPDGRIYRNLELRWTALAEGTTS